MIVNIRINELELRSCSNDGDVIHVHTTLEIIEWQSVGHCYVVAYWVSNSDDEPDLKFVGDRPFKCDRDDFWALAELGQIAVQKMLARTEEEE